ncbi:hypothetical protein MRB53_010646 [Persea americana]|uniref:Uncharacterized protein n=1 Tax=Persea americana TaxID=3435 RepID=A0ACC2LSJ7_PERAE|nr:hypothetical protein MRB53_010646 [Persea americana]|eukprot:TRINITY_DN3446_c1_g1_i1.p1 TRINITY_DN3446_c1_g1~~TRINITY_DN3446_c1_g1_i1.p1  ORF type:complete len:116 (-),score=9.53 TRINITY_DN3446_c1_g1_i1:649-996(-)
MGFLDKLWDDTVAGPRPENGLSRLRKYSSFSPRSSISKGLDGEDFAEGPRMTRSITIARPEENRALENGSPSPSPAGSTPPVSPFFGKNEAKGYRKRLSTEAYEKALLHIPTTEI